MEKKSKLSGGNIAGRNIVQEDLRVVKVHWIPY